MAATTSGSGIDSILDALPTHILYCDSRLRLRYANAAAQLGLSVSRQEARGQLLGEVMPLQRADGDALRDALSGQRQDCRRLTRLPDRRVEYRRICILPMPTSSAGGVLIVSVRDRDRSPEPAEARRLVLQCLRALWALRSLDLGVTTGPKLRRSDAVRHTDAAIRAVREQLAALLGGTSAAAGTERQEQGQEPDGSGASTRLVRQVFDVLPAALIARSSEGRMILANRLARTWFPDRLPASGAEAAALDLGESIEVHEYAFAARTTRGRVTVVQTAQPGGGAVGTVGRGTAQRQDLLVARLDAVAQTLFAAGLTGATRAGVGTPELHRAVTALETAITDLRLALGQADDLSAAG